MKKILPSLHGLVNLAADGPLVRTGDIEELELTIQQLQSALRQALLPTAIPSSRPLSGSNLTPPVLRSNKRRAHLDVMPPSPEAMQRRKISHGTM